MLFFVVDLPSLLTFDWSFIIIRASNMSRNFCSDSKYGCVREGGSRMPMRQAVAERLAENRMASTTALTDKTSHGMLVFFFDPQGPTRHPKKA